MVSPPRRSIATVAIVVRDDDEALAWHTGIQPKGGVAP